MVKAEWEGVMGEWSDRRLGLTFADIIVVHFENHLPDILWEFRYHFHLSLALVKLLPWLCLFVADAAIIQRWRHSHIGAD